MRYESPSKWHFLWAEVILQLSVTSTTSQLILQPFRRFTHVTAHSPTFLSVLLRHRLLTYVTWRAAHDVENEWDTRGPVSDIFYEQSSFSNLSVTSPRSQLILQPFRRFTYVTAHSWTLPLLTYVTTHSPTLFSLLLRQRLNLRHLARCPLCKQRMR